MTPGTDRFSSKRARTQRKSTRLALLAVIAMALVAVLGACSSESQEQIQDGVDSGDIELPDVELPDVEVPDVEVPDVEVPDVDTPEEPDVEEESLSTEEWILIGILAVAAFALIVGGTSASARHSEKKQAAKSALNTQLAEIVGGSRWMVDQGSVEIMHTTDSTQLRTSWDDLRRRAIDLEGQISALAAGSGDGHLDESLRYLGQQVAGLRGALDSLVSLRTAPDATTQQTLIANAEQTVQERRQQTSAAIEPVAAARR